jgi:hypothetical protein
MSVDTRTSIQSVNFNITHDCKLACRYCCGAFGFHPARTGGPAKLRSMNETTARRSILWALQEINSNDDEFTFGCLGGEPLFKFRLIRRMKNWLDEASERFGKKLKLSLFTNAVLLNEETLDFLLAHDIGIIVSIDGPPEVHDRNRPHRNGSGSSAEVIRNVRRLPHKRPDSITARGTFARWNFLEGWSYVDIIRCWIWDSAMCGSTALVSVGPLTFFTGLAVVNPAKDPAIVADVAIIAYDRTGRRLACRQVYLGGTDPGTQLDRPHRGAYLPQNLMPELGAVFGGYLIVEDRTLMVGILVFELFGDTSASFLSAVPTIPIRGIEQ